MSIINIYMYMYFQTISRLGSATSASRHTKENNHFQNALKVDEINSFDDLLHKLSCTTLPSDIHSICKQNKFHLHTGYILDDDVPVMKECLVLPSKLSIRAFIRGKFLPLSTLSQLLPK